jgi:sortase A
MAVLGLLAGCGAVTGPDSASRPTPAASPTPTTSADLTRTPAPSQTSSQAPSQPPTQSPAPRRATGPEPSDGKPRDALLTIPRIRVFELPVVAYEGWTDDGPGTEIQNRGVAASPHGPRGGTGPGGVGNYQVTAHRLSSTQAFLRLPELENGDRVIVDAAEVRYVYQIVETRETSFRSEESLRAQRAAVPGRPGVAPTEAMITLSTCATPEDHAAGNYWADEFDNPEHRIDKIGVLVETR